LKTQNDYDPPRERVLAMLKREPVDRLPVDLWQTPEIGAALGQHTGTGKDPDMYKAIGLDKIVWVFMDYLTDTGEIAGAQVGAAAREERTMWGVPLEGVRAGAAHCEESAAAPMKGFECPAPCSDHLPHTETSVAQSLGEGGYLCVKATSI